VPLRRPAAPLALLPLLLPLLLHWPRTAGAAERRMVDEVVAVVEAQTITLSELEAQTRVELVLLRGATLASIPLGRPLLAASLKRLVDERIVLAEVERLRLFDLDRSELEKEQIRFRARFPSLGSYEAFLGLLEMTDEELGAVLARGLRVARYLDSRLRLPSQVRDAEIDDAARAQGGPPLTRQQREELQKQLQRDKYERLLAELLAELRRRANVRVLDPIDPQAWGR
jgi:hypothetical protein